jgi:hypothetical protein
MSLRDGSFSDRHLLPRSYDVVESALRSVAIVCAGLVLISFGLFARDQFSGASENQQREIVGGLPRVPGVVPQPTHHGQPRRFIDGAARELESPFAHLVDSPSDWAKHGIPAFLGLALYGFGLGFLARYAHGRK